MSDFEIKKCGVCGNVLHSGASVASGFRTWGMDETIPIDYKTEESYWCDNETCKNYKKQIFEGEAGKRIKQNNTEVALNSKDERIRKQALKSLGEKNSK